MISSRRRLVLLLCVLVTHTNAQAHSTTHPAEEESGADVERPMAKHQNTLADEIEREEFVDSESNQPHSRQKRLIWITDDGRLALPPGTSLTVTPTIALPLVRHPPEGFFSNMSISFPLTIDFDKLGLTDNQNPLGDLPPIFARSFGHTAGKMLGSYVARYLHAKAKRDTADQTEPLRRRRNAAFQIEEGDGEGDGEAAFPTLPDRFKHIFHGGERVLLYGVVEDFLSTFGMDGRACLLRFICEIHARNLDHFGIFGEMMKLFLTVTKSPFSELIPEYVRAQQVGEGRAAPGECFPYYKQCPKSIFKAAYTHNYGEQQTKGEYYEEQVRVVKKDNSLLNQKRNELLTTNEIEQKRLLPM